MVTHSFAETLALAQKWLGVKDDSPVTAVSLEECVLNPYQL